MVTNAHVADLLRRYAAVLSLEGADKFKLRAYRRAAQTIEGLHEPVAERSASGTLTDLPGIGNAISEIVAEIVTTGKLARLEAKAAAERCDQRDAAGEITQAPGALMASVSSQPPYRVKPTNGAADACCREECSGLPPAKEIVPLFDLCVAAPRTSSFAPRKNALSRSERRR